MSTTIPLPTDTPGLFFVQGMGQYAEVRSLAKDCGITIPDMRLITIGDKDVLLVKRFPISVNLQPVGTVGAIPAGRPFAMANQRT